MVTVVGILTVACVFKSDFLYSAVFAVPVPVIRYFAFCTVTTSPCLITDTELFFEELSGLEGLDGCGFDGSGVGVGFGKLIFP